LVSYYPGERLHDVFVYFAGSFPSAPGSPPDKDAADSVACAQFPGPGTDGQVINLNCAAGASGRYLVIQIVHQDQEYLTLCEVEVLLGM